MTAPSHVGALLEFAAAAPRRRLLLRLGVAADLLEVTGTDGTLILPDPNDFDGDDLRPATPGGRRPRR